MALVQFSSIVTKIVGKVKGHYFSGSLGGATLQSCPNQKTSGYTGSQTTSATNPYNRAQVSKTLIYIVRSWKSVSASNKLAWAAAAPNFPTTNKLGIAVKPSGYHTYVHLNYGYYLQNAALLSTPPAIQIGILPISILAVVISSTAVTVSLGAIIPANYTGYILATKSISAGVKPSPTDFTQIKPVATGTSGDVLCFNDYVSKFGAPITGDTLWLALQLRSSITGLKGQLYIIGNVIS